MITKIYVNGEWVEGEPTQDGQKYRVYLNETPESGYSELTYKVDALEPIMVTVSLDKSQCEIGTAVNYDISFSEPITVPFIVPISVSDRNGNHIRNIGCSVTDGVATGSFTMNESGDFTVTDEAINYHHTVIERPLKLVEQPWLRVYTLN